MVTLPGTAGAASPASTGSLRPVQAMAGRLPSQPSPTLPMATHPRPARLVAASLVLLAPGLTACSGDGPADPGPALATYRAPGGPVHLDLAAELGTAEVHLEKTAIRPAHIDDRGHLTAGWSFPDHGDDATAEVIHPVWNRDRETEVTFHLAEAGPRTVTFRIGTFRAVTAEDPLGLVVRLNGVELERHELPPGGKQLTVDLPVEHQVVGPNRLGLDFDAIWRIRDHVEGSGDVRMVSANCKELLFEHGESVMAERLAEGAYLLPEGARVDPDGPAGARTLVQRSGTLVRHHLEVPAGARLTTGVAMTRRGDAAPEGARFRVTLTDTAGATTTLLDEPAALGEDARPVEADLAPWAGQVVRLDLSVVAEGGGPEPVVGLWAAPAVQAPEPATPPVPAGLADARADMAKAPVVMILLDAFNPFFAPSYGGRAGIAPNLDRIQAEGTQFDVTYAPATYTISSVPSILTSRFTWEHGAWKEDTPLLDTIPTWPQAFTDAGYRTVGFSCSTNGSSLFGFDRGFEEFRDLYDQVREGRETIAAEQVLEPLAEVLAVEDERPLFLWLHIVEPHEPYLPPEPYAGRYSGEIDSPITGDAATLWDIRFFRKQPTELELAKLKAEYEDNITYVDAMLAKMRAQLEAAGVWDEAILMIFSDHGEAFLDHESPVLAGMGHGSTVYDDQARIPLWVRLPGGAEPASTNLPALASNMDLLPTVADLVGVEAPDEDLRGVSLAPALFDAARQPRAGLVTHSANRMNTKRFLPTLALRQGKWKYVFTSGNRDELYDLEADPGETVNVVADHPLVAGWLRQELKRRSGFRPDTGGLTIDTGTMELDEETLERMRALGYVR